MSETGTRLLEDAETRVEAERDATSAKLSAFDRFASGVDDVPTDSPPASPADSGRTIGSPGAPTVRSGVGPTAMAVGSDATDRASVDSRRAVRDLFAETVRPRSVDDVDVDVDADADGTEPLCVTLAEELGDDVAVALAPSTDRQFTPELKQGVLEAVDQRRAELETMRGALDTEATSLESTIETVEEIREWFRHADETPLLELGFDALRRRHEALADHRRRCRDRLDRRQEVLRETTVHGGAAGLEHRTLVTYLYGNLPSTYPVLTTVLCLLEQCRTAQRAVRDHLTRRV
ncbi:DUF7260 family protein [Halobiforma nitratireducens]|uniref:DUF7260 domain-containing protein n=1 Tax=Halobiforma nitratireducens JCM 10879 TaxID=1227454 RepID=M0LH53_9EURY|nr:hypothetical protein [Halobiforma nitratireducens]EMA31325.1 hypothetical protein C446_15825 [Halobiforma nitratireducens JCM 10879]